MAQLTAALRAEYGLIIGRIPDDVLRRIPQAELADRLVEARSLLAKSTAANEPTIRKAFGALADALLGAQPRADTEQQVAGLLKKAAISNNQQAAALRARAEQVKAANPTAPRRHGARLTTLAKAEMEGMIAVYDQAGNLVGVVDPNKITPIAQPKAPGTPTEPPPAPPAQPGQDDGVAKRVQLARPGFRQQATTRRPR